MTVPITGGSDLDDARGRPVLVTGAASGIGRAVARRLSIRHSVWAADVDAAALERLAGDLPPSATLRLVDVRDAWAVERLMTEATALGAFEAVVACAGLSCPGVATELDPSRWERTLAVNTLGVMYVIRAVLPVMQQQGFGTIVVVASASGRVTYVGEPAYIASKHATVAFCDAVRKEIVGTGVRMSVIEPGLVDTPMSRSHPAIDSVVGTVAPLDPDDVARAIEFVIEMPPHCSVNEVTIRPTNQEL